MTKQPKRTVWIFAGIGVLIAISFLLQVSLTITLNNTVPKDDADRLFRTYGLNVSTRYYPTVFWTRIKFVGLPRDDYQKHLAVATALIAEDKSRNGDKYIIQGASPYGKYELQIQANERATPEEFNALIRRVKGLEQTEPFLRYSPKIFYTHTPLIPGIFTGYRLRHEPEVNYVETGIVSIPLLYVLDSLINRKP